jgi:hypothetical protein
MRGGRSSSVAGRASPAPAALLLLALLLAALPGALRAEQGPDMSGVYAGTGAFGRYTLHVVQQGTRVRAEVKDTAAVAVLGLQGVTDGGTASRGRTQDTATGEIGAYELRWSAEGIRLAVFISMTRHDAFFARGAGEGTAADGVPGGRRDGQAAGAAANGAGAGAGGTAGGAGDPRIVGCHLATTAEGTREHWLCIDGDGRSGSYEHIAFGREPGENGRRPVELHCTGPLEARLEENGGVLRVAVPARPDACERGDATTGLRRIEIACAVAGTGLDCTLRLLRPDGTALGDGPSRLAFARPDGGAGAGAAGAAGNDGAGGGAVLPDF